MEIRLKCPYETEPLLTDPNWAVQNTFELPLDEERKFYWEFLRDLEIIEIQNKDILTTENSNMDYSPIFVSKSRKCLHLNSFSNYFKDTKKYGGLIAMRNRHLHLLSQQFE